MWLYFDKVNNLAFPENLFFQTSQPRALSAFFKFFKLLCACRACVFTSFCACLLSGWHAWRASVYTCLYSLGVCVLA